MGHVGNKTLSEKLQTVIQEFDSKMVKLKDYQIGDYCIAKRILGTSSYYQALCSYGDIGAFYIIKGSHE
jgi:hypothetical protein